jgi:hypothetical protein
MDHGENILAARELLTATKRTLQVLDEQIVVLQNGRVAVSTADDVSSEHRFAMFGAVDSLDGDNGIDLGSGDAVDGFGFQNPKRGIIRIQEDAAFVCTNILVAIGATEETEDSLGSNVKNKLFSEFTIPRAGAVRAEVYNMGIWNGENDYTMRAFVSLVGYKVFGA